MWTYNMGGRNVAVRQQAATKSVTNLITTKEMQTPGDLVIGRLPDYDHKQQNSSVQIASGLIKQEDSAIQYLQTLLSPTPQSSSKMTSDELLLSSAPTSAMLQPVLSLPTAPVPIAELKSSMTFNMIAGPSVSVSAEGNKQSRARKRRRKSTATTNNTANAAASLTSLVPAPMTAASIHNGYQSQDVQSIMLRGVVTQNGSVDNIQTGVPSTLVQSSVSTQSSSSSKPKNQAGEIFPFGGYILPDPNNRKLDTLFPVDTVCDFCAYTCKDRKNMRRHIRTVHFDYKPYACSFCTFTTARKDKLKRHIDCVHSTGEKAFRCEHCFYTSGRKDKMKEHIQSVHLGIKTSGAKWLIPSELFS